VPVPASTPPRAAHRVHRPEAPAGLKRGMRSREGSSASASARHWRNGRPGVARRGAETCVAAPPHRGKSASGDAVDHVLATGLPSGRNPRWREALRSRAIRPPRPGRGRPRFPASAGADGSRLPPVAVGATDLADGTGAVAASAAAGHVVFSRQAPSTGRFELVAWSAGRGLRVLPVGDRAVPFDADVGRDAPGGAVVSYSHCAVDGTVSYVLPSVDFSAARPRAATESRVRSQALTATPGPENRPAAPGNARGLSRPASCSWAVGVVGLG
jgi:hypothetical protein